MGQGLVMRYIVFPKFVELEEQGAKRDMARIREGITSELANLDLLCHDWASWDDAIAFVEGRKANFVEINIPDEFFTSSSIDYLHFIDQTGRTKYIRGIDPVTGNTFVAPGLAGDQFLRSGLSFKGQDVNEEETGSLVHSGLVYVASIHEPLLLSVRPILISRNYGPVHGTLIMGRFLRLEALQQKVGVNIKMYPMDNLQDTVNRAVVQRLQSGEQPPLLRYDAGDIYFYHVQNSIYNSALALIAGYKPAEIKRNGATATRTAMFCYLVVSILFLAAVSFLLSRIVTRPIRFLSDKTGEIVKSGNFSGEIKVKGQGEIAHLGRSINGLLQRITGHEKLLFAANKKLLQQSLTDPLTGLSNRRDFDVYMENEWIRLRRSKQPLSVIMCDVDYFKKYNDAYGHQRGDTCLRSLATLLSGVVNRPADLPARYGGEEFVLVLPETDHEGACHVGQMICDGVRGLKIEHAVSSVCPWVTMSVGVATVIPDDQLNSDYLVRMADEALYRAKAQGRNQVVAFEP